MKITDQYVFFWGDDDPFSNFYPAQTPITFGGKVITFRTSEHAFMYTKAMYFSDSETADLVLKASHPLNAKKLGRQVKNFNDELWTMVSMNAMFDANWGKYSSNDHLKTVLLETGDKIIVEASPYDRIWGVGLGENDPKILDQKQWRGQNKLGKVLMKVREKLRKT
jgi:ribA/ribD-fused uncharacterized protein